MVCIFARPGFDTTNVEKLENILYLPGAYERHTTTKCSRVSAGVRPYRAPLFVTVTIMCSVIRVWLVVARVLSAGVQLAINAGTSPVTSCGSNPR